MFITLRLISLAFCYKDGDPNNKALETELGSREKYYRIVETPTVLEFLYDCILFLPLLSVF